MKITNKNLHLISESAFGIFIGTFTLIGFEAKPNKNKSTKLEMYNKDILNKSITFFSKCQ